MALDVLIVLDHRDPLVLAAVVDSPDDVGHVDAQLNAEHTSTAFVGVVAANDEAHLRLVLAAVRQHLAEVVFTAAADGSGLDASAAATSARDVHGLGEDLVFQVDDVGAAVRYARDAVLAQDRGWEGTALLVLGDAAAVDAARRALA